jgi:hypothetical protein
MREIPQALIVPTDDGESLFNSAQNRRKTGHQFAIEIEIPIIRLRG